MRRWHKVRAVAAFEFLSEVKRLGYLIGVFGMPVFLLAYAGLISLIGFIAKKNESAVKIYGVVDQANVLRLAGDLAPAVELPPEINLALKQQGLDLRNIGAPAWWDNVVFRPFKDGDSAMAALREKTIKGWYLIHADYMQSGIVDSYFAEWAGLGTKDSEGALRNLLQDRVMSGKVSADLAARIRQPLQKGKSWTVKAGGELSERSLFSVIARFAIPLVFAILMLISVFGTSAALINGTAVEKENKVVDVLLSSADPEEIMTGKLLGLAGTGLLQMAVWFGMAGIAGLVFAGALAAAGVEIAWSAIGAGIVFFLAGYLFLGSLMLGTGALGSNAKEGQQWSLIWTLITFLPMMFMESFINAPHGTLAKVLTWMPFSSPLMVVFRLTMDPAGIAWWEILGALTVLVISIRLALRFGARLFRIGLLLPGGRAKLSDILRQARL